MNKVELLTKMENKTGYHNYRFICRREVADKLLAYDGSLLEAKVKQVATDLEQDEQPDNKNIFLQFSTQNCGQRVAQQRLIKFLIEALTN
jgi:hypothetical protein